MIYIRILDIIRVPDLWSELISAKRAEVIVVKVRLSNETTGEIWEQEFYSVRYMAARVGWITSSGDKVVFEIIDDEVGGR